MSIFSYLISDKIKQNYEIGKVFFILFLILLTMPAYAQKGVDITGTVIEEGTNEPIEQATVRLLSVKRQFYDRRCRHITQRRFRTQEH